ncbi:MAG: cysteine--tRNA ligase [Actinobacteria bacterium]|nr:cysteine--tRNA ligase [Actinomycetota bacterium]
MRLYNTLTRRVEELRPREPGRVAMYVCGPTVQGAPHLGHARPALVPDVLRRYLQWRGWDVLHVRNVTDVDDKIIARAEAEGRHPAAVAEEYTRVYDEQMARLGVLPPHIAPRATGHIIEMIALITRLVELGSAYEVGGDVFFRVRSFPRYGRLSGRDVDELRAGERVEPDERKADPLDFALWKAAKPGEPSWPSPWGPGRPGWHVECSAMAAKYLGEGFDVHGGGQDLVFPHHENEIAQSEAATGRPFARHWLHNALLSMSGAKMSKSVGNIVALGEALDRWGPNVLRQLYLSAHYRSPLDLHPGRLAEASAAVGRWEAYVRAAEGLDARSDPSLRAGAVEAFTAAMDDDLGTPRAHAVLFELVTAGHEHLQAGREPQAAAARDTFLELAGVLGYAFGAASDGARVGPLVAELLRLREDARARRDFTTADSIRDRLSEAGVVVEDTPAGPRWHVG